MESAIFGLMGVLVGALMAEYFRRRRRIETFMSEVFRRRLEIYEALNAKLNACAKQSNDIIENPSYSKEQRHAIWSDVVLDLAECLDTHNLYMNAEIATHCVIMVMDIEDIHDLQDEHEKQRQILDFRGDLRAAREMIRAETGLSRIDSTFRSVTKAKHDSRLLSLIRDLKKRYAKDEKSEPKSAV